MEKFSIVIPIIWGGDYLGFIYLFAQGVLLTVLLRIADPKIGRSHSGLEADVERGAANEGWGDVAIQLRDEGADDAQAQGAGGLPVDVGENADAVGLDGEQAAGVEGMHRGGIRGRDRAQIRMTVPSAASWTPRLIFPLENARHLLD